MLILFYTLIILFGVTIVNSINLRVDTKSKNQQYGSDSLIHNYFDKRNDSSIDAKELITIRHDDYINTNNTLEYFQNLAIKEEATEISEYVIFKIFSPCILIYIIY